MPNITPFLWFDHQAEEAAQLYVSVFPNSRITGVTRSGPGGPGPEGQALTVSFELDGKGFTALNGGPHFRFTEAVSFYIDCQDQAEVDHYWEKLTADGGEPGQCGWLKDRFGLSWQVVPVEMTRWIGDPDRERQGRVVQAMMKMRKLDLEALRRAYEGAG